MYYNANACAKLQHNANSSMNHANSNKHTILREEDSSPLCAAFWTLIPHVFIKTKALILGSTLKVYNAKNVPVSCDVGTGRASDFRHKITKEWTGACWSHNPSRVILKPAGRSHQVWQSWGWKKGNSSAALGRLPFKTMGLLRDGASLNCAPFPHSEWKHEPLRGGFSIMAGLLQSSHQSVTADTSESLAWAVLIIKDGAPARCKIQGVCVMLTVFLSVSK